MTPTTLAAALIADVPKYTAHHVVSTISHPEPVWLHETEVLAVLSRALDPALLERAGEVLAWLSHVDNDGHTRFQGKTTSEHAADLLTALLTANAALRAERDGLLTTWAESRERHLAAEAEVEKLRGALTPSGETKAAYMGEFSIPFQTVDEDGNEVMLRPNVPWTTIKEIMAAIRARAAITEKTDGLR